MTTLPYAEDTVSVGAGTGQIWHWLMQVTLDREVDLLGPACFYLLFPHCAGFSHIKPHVCVT